MVRSLAVTIEANPAGVAVVQNYHCIQSSLATSSHIIRSFSTQPVQLELRASLYITINMQHCHLLPPGGETGYYGLHERAMAGGGEVVVLEGGEGTFGS